MTAGPILPFTISYYNMLSQIIQLFVFLALLGAFQTSGFDFSLVWVVLFGDTLSAFALSGGLGLFDPFPTVSGGVVLVYGGPHVFGSWLFYVRMWFLAGFVRNRLMHALNGNISGARVRLYLLPFFIVFGLVFILDLLTGFQFGFLGTFRIVWSTSSTRLGRLLGSSGYLMTKVAILYPLYVILLIFSPVLFALFILYDTLTVFIVVFWPDKVRMVAPSARYSRGGAKIKAHYDSALPGASVGASAVDRHDEDIMVSGQMATPAPFGVQVWFPKLFRRRPASGGLPAQTGLDGSPPSRPPSPVKIDKGKRRGSSSSLGSASSTGTRRPSTPTSQPVGFLDQRHQELYDAIPEADRSSVARVRVLSGKGFFYDGSGKELSFSSS